MTFGFVYPKDYIVSWILPVAAASCKKNLAFFWLIMSWRVGFSFRCVTAPIANPFTFRFPNTSWNNVHHWAEYCNIDCPVFSSHHFFSWQCHDHLMTHSYKPHLLHWLISTRNSVAKFLLIGGGTIPTSESKQLNQYLQTEENIHTTRASQYPNC